MVDMIRKMTSTNFLLKSSVFFMIIVLGVFFSCNHKFNTQKNICGFWGVYEDSSYVERSRDFGIVGNLLYIHREGVSLPRNYYPVIGEDSMSIEEKQEKRIELNVLCEKESKGTWDVIGSTPDSVIFIAPNHPLEGRYKVHIYQIGLYEYMILSNDSTYLSCYRGGY